MLIKTSDDAWIVRRVEGGFELYSSSGALQRTVKSVDELLQIPEVSEGIKKGVKVMSNVDPSLVRAAIKTIGPLDIIAVIAVPLGMKIMEYFGAEMAPGGVERQAVYEAVENQITIDTLNSYGIEARYSNGVEATVNGLADWLIHSPGEYVVENSYLFRKIQGSIYESDVNKVLSKIIEDVNERLDGDWRRVERGVIKVLEEGLDEYDDGKYEYLRKGLEVIVSSREDSTVKRLVVRKVGDRIAISWDPKK